MIHATFTEAEKATAIHRVTGLIVMSVAYVGVLIGLQTFLFT